MNVKVNIEKQTVDLRKRNKRPINVVHWHMQFTKTDRIPYRALYYKSSEGHYLFSLNRKNEPIQCWSNVRGISTIRCAIITADKFQKILDRINPKLLYLNDGQHLNIQSYKIHVFYNKDIKTILKEIALTDDDDDHVITANEHYDDDDKIKNKTNTNVVNKKTSTLSVDNGKKKREKPTFKMLRELDPTITRKEYYKYIDGWQ